MTEETLRKEGQYLTKALPMYLAVQVAILLFTALDTPLYLDLYRVNHFFTVSGWIGAWFVLVIFGLANAVFLLARRSWRVLFEENVRVKLALGYFIGGITGLLTLGVRVIPIIAPQYFLQVGVLAVLPIGAYLIWNRHGHKSDELFP